MEQTPREERESGGSSSLGLQRSPGSSQQKSNGQRALKSASSALSPSRRD